MSATAVVCGSLIDGTGADPVRGATVLIEGDRITRVARGDVPSDAQVVDASDLTVLPGLIDAHVHIGLSTLSLEERLLTPPSLYVARALVNARVTLRAGFTTVRDGGGTPRGVKMAIDEGLFPGPRLRISVGAISQTGGHGDQYLPAGVQARTADPERPLAIADGVDGVRRATRELLRAGADQIKVLASGGALSPGDEVGATGFSPEELAAIVYEARGAGRLLMAHAHSARGIRNAVDAGIDSIEHGTYLDEETALEMRRRGTFLVPTLAATIWMKRRAEAKPGSVPPYAVRKNEEMLRVHAGAFRMAREIGVRIAMGSDTAVGPHGSNGEEIALMIENGMPPMDAIVAATGTAAECVGLAGDVGTVAVGKLADLVGLRGDPLTEPHLFADPSRVALVMKGGVLVR